MQIQITSQLQSDLLLQLKRKKNCQKFLLQQFLVRLPGCNEFNVQQPTTMTLAKRIQKLQITASATTSWASNNHKTLQQKA
jgi:hypothetical protein